MSTKHLTLEPKVWAEINAMHFRTIKTFGIVLPIYYGLLYLIAH